MRIRNLAATTILLCGCTQIDVVAVRLEEPTQVPDAQSADARRDPDPPDSAAPSADAAEPAMPCAYGTPAGGGASERPALVIDKLEHAICSCDSITSSDPLTTDVVQGTSGADVGVNGEMSVESTSTLGGSLSIAGSGGLHLADNIELNVAGSLHVGGPLEGSLATARIARDAEVAGRIDLGALFVTLALTQPLGTERRVQGTSQIGELRAADVLVAPPCDCATTALFDTSAFVATEAPRAIPWAAAAAGDMQRCAAYALPDGEIAATHITLQHSAAIYVPGDLHVTGDLSVDSEAGAEIDLFIADDVRIDGRLRVGTAKGQGPVRIYVGGSGTVQLTGGGELYGALYAPKAELVLSAPLALRGALFVRRIAASAALTVHHDRSVAGASSP